MTGLPEWLTIALRSFPDQASSGLSEESPTEVLPGDICVVGPFDAPHELGRLIIVIDVFDTWCKGMLASIETELATEVDAVLSQPMTGLGYEIVAHSRYVGDFWLSQVRRRVGALSIATLEELEELSWRDDAQVSVPTGVPLQPDFIDPRYPALRALSKELDRLADHCRRRRHDLADPILDPMLADADVLRTVLVEPGWDAQLATAMASPGFRDRLIESFPKLSPDEQRAAMRLLERAAATAAPSRRTAQATVPELAAHVDEQALLDALGSAAVQPAIVVLSHRTCWQSAPARSARLRFNASEEFVIFRSFTEAPLLEVA